LRQCGIFFLHFNANINIIIFLIFFIPFL